MIPKLTDAQIQAVATSYLTSGSKSLLLTFGTAAAPTVVPTHSTNPSLGTTQVSVNVSYPYSGFLWTPAIAKLVTKSNGTSLPATVTLSATSVMVDE
jgi:hypothetical protein